MDPNTFPTKGNLILAKNSLALAKQGYVLMDKKRNILIRELMGLIQQAESIQKEIDSTFRMAYAALQMANIKLGIVFVECILLKESQTDDSGDLQCQFLVIRKYITTNQFYDLH